MIKDVEMYIMLRHYSTGIPHILNISLAFSC